MSLSFEVKGMENLQLDIEGVVQKIHDPNNLVRDAAYTLQRQIVKNASGRPGPRIGTSQLVSSITAEIISYDKARVGTYIQNPPYPVFLEFGHRQHPGQFVPPLHKRLVKDFAPAYPFFYPAIDQCKEELEGLSVTFSHKIEGDWK